MRKLFLGLMLSFVGTAAIVLAANGGAEAGGTSVTETGIDLNTSGNSGTAVGTVQSELGNIDLNTPFAIDVYVKDVPATGTSGVGGELIFNGAVVQVINPITMDGLPTIQFTNASPTPFNVLDPRPHTDGSWRFDSIDLDAEDPSGSGVLIRITLECIAQGTSHLGLTDTSTGGGATVGVLGGPNGVYEVGAELEADIGCDTDVGPGETPTPVATTPVATTPVATTPVATTPVATTPVATTPVATTPGATTPVATTPVATTPVATTPVATTPVATTPVATTPVVTTPGVTASPTPTATPTGTAAPTATAAPTCNTALTANAAVGATTITVGTAAGCAAGDKITIGTGTTQETVTIASVSGSTITLTTGLTKAHTSGEAVKEVASATASPTKTPATLPKTGAADVDGGIGSLLLVLLIGAALIIAAIGGMTYARTERKD